jgi:two-component system sensor histidine kinase AlgZ
MHPILARRRRFLWYLLAWATFGALLGYLLSVTSALHRGESEALAVPLCILYAFICLAPWYSCRMVPLGLTNAARLMLNHGSAALVAAGIWTLGARLLAYPLTKYFGGLNERLRPQLALLFGVGVLLYLLAVALHYAGLALMASRVAESRESEARLLAREAELKALKAQINPHFLFNSLNSISALATVDGKRAREMCIKLSDFLRSTLSVGERDRVPLGEELALTRTYLDVEQVRFGSRLGVEQIIDPGCERCPIPPLMLQPLVENAIKHGIAGLVEGGTIRLAAGCRDGLLRLTIENEFDPEAPSATRNGLGLANVRGRLKSNYDDHARLDAVSNGTRFVVELTVPCPEHAREES